jgi:putative ubiquitin-RnfH superfamily antitoxin RatB of RatAB toxin-antitoxin module
MQIGVAYAEPEQQVWLKLEVPPGSTLLEALNRSGILSRFPQVDLKRQKVGIFGKFAKLDTPLRNGDRVEIYRPITVDPTKVKRRKLNTT